MHRKSIVRNLLVALAVLTVMATGVTVLVLAASGDSVSSVPSAPQLSSPQSLSDEPAAPSLLSLSPVQTSAAEIRLLYTDELVSYQTVYQEDASLPRGKQVVQTEGQNGLLRHTVEIILHDGIEVSRQDAGTRTIRETVDEVIRIGTYAAPAASTSSSHSSFSSSGNVSSVSSSSTPSSTASYDYTRNFLKSVSIDTANKTITTPCGEVFSYTSSFTGEATAYSCEGNPNATTATGTRARVGEVAVDPNVIPLGTKLFIMLSDGSLIYGYCVAEDIGGAVKGNIVDLYMNTFADCALVGRSDCTVYVLS